MWARKLWAHVGDVIHVYMFAQTETYPCDEVSLIWAPMVVVRAYGIRMQGVVHPYSTPTVSMTLEGWESLYPH